MKYNKNTIYITGISKSNTKDPITIMYNCFFLGVIIDKTDDIIVDVTCNTISSSTTEFIKSIIVGNNIVKDLESIIDEIRNRFLATAQRALIVALKDAHNKYTSEKSKIIEK